MFINFTAENILALSKSTENSVDLLSSAYLKQQQRQTVAQVLGYLLSLEKECVRLSEKPWALTLWISCGVWLLQSSDSKLCNCTCLASFSGWWILNHWNIESSATDGKRSFSNKNWNECVVFKIYFNKKVHKNESIYFGEVSNCNQKFLCLGTGPLQ